MPLEEGLTTEARNPASEGLDRLSSAELVALFNREDARAVRAIRAVARELASAVDVVADRLRRGGRLIYFGAGTSGRLGVLDASECPPTFGVPSESIVARIAGGDAALRRPIEGAEDDPAAGAAEVDDLRVEAKDVVVGIAASGRTPYVLGAVDRARERGAFTIGIACNRPCRLEESVHLMIAPIVGPEVLAGSTRMKAGTATKLVLNALTTGAMVRMGKTLGNRMVDLVQANEKLRVRTRRILRDVADLSDTEAQHLLDTTGGRLKPALVMALAGVDLKEAERRLEAADGLVADAIRGTPR